MFRHRLVAAALVLTAPCAAAPQGERWTATSTTSLSITGNVTLEANRIVFAGGTSLPIARVRNVTFDDDTGNKVPASLYRVTTPADPKLLRGNQLCGGPQGPVTYIAIWHVKPVMPGQAQGRAFAAYSGQNEPQPSARGSCGTYYYEMAK